MSPLILGGSAGGDVRRCGLFQSWATAGMVAPSVTRMLPLRSFLGSAGCNALTASTVAATVSLTLTSAASAMMSANRSRYCLVVALHLRRAGLAVVNRIDGGDDAALVVFLAVETVQERMRLDGPQQLAEVASQAHGLRLDQLSQRLCPRDHDTPLAGRQPALVIVPCGVTDRFNAALALEFGDLLHDGLGLRFRVVGFHRQHARFVFLRSDWRAWW